MLRFPVSHIGVVPAAAVGVFYTQRPFSSHEIWSNPQQEQQRAPSTLSSAGAVDEDRVARWCRRLWDITRDSVAAVPPTHLLPRPNQIHEAQLKTLDKAAAARAVAGAATLNSVDAVTKAVTANAPEEERTGPTDVAALLARLQRAVDGDSGSIPGAIVEDVWAVFDFLVPPAMQYDVTPASITPEIEEKFFAFASTLNELDFDLQAVVQVSKELEVKLEAYMAQLRLLENKEKQLAASRLTKSAADCVNEANEFAECLMKLKSAVMQCCFQASYAGAPLYYTLLHHTASLSDGLRRLMHFRKLVHYFESLCKRRIKEYDVELKAAPSNITPATKDDLVRQQFKWRSRQIKVGLIESALSHLFHDFFAKEYLVMEELTWFSTPPSLLDQIMRAEGVHPFVNGLDDMRSRLQPTRHRHLFAFLHPAVVEEPLIAVQVALTNGIASSVDHILGRPTPLADPVNTTNSATLFRQLEAAELADGDVDTAIFYSINSAQSALRGMDMGNRLIKRVAKEIEGNINASRQGRNLTPIHTFSTLSPIPLYVKWLAGQVAAMSASPAAAPTGIFGGQLTLAKEERMFLEPLREAVAGLILRHPLVLPMEASVVAASSVPAAARSGAKSNSDADATLLTKANVAVLQYLLRLFETAPMDSGAGWWDDHAFTAALEGPLLRSVAVYLLTVKRYGGARIRDPVGNFHVSNGATIYRLNFLGNTTAQGSRESACVMVNYWYDMPTVSANVAEYEVSQRIALGESIKALLGKEVV